MFHLNVGSAINAAAIIFIKLMTLQDKWYPKVDSSKLHRWRFIKIFHQMFDATNFSAFKHNWMETAQSSFKDSQTL